MKIIILICIVFTLLNCENIKHQNDNITVITNDTLVKKDPCFRPITPDDLYGQFMWMHVEPSLCYEDHDAIRVSIGSKYYGVRNSGNTSVFYVKEADLFSFESKGIIIYQDYNRWKGIVMYLNYVHFFEQPKITNEKSRARGGEVWEYEAKINGKYHSVKYNYDDLSKDSQYQLFKTFFDNFPYKLEGKVPWDTLGK